MTLPIVQLALNIKSNTRLKSSAFEVIHGRPFNGFMDFTQAQNTQDLQELIARRLEHNSALKWYIYPELASRNKEYKKDRYDRLDQQVKQAVEITPGDLVYAKDMTRSSKWDPIYEGPFTVIRQNEGKAYILADETGIEIQPARTVDQLKLVDQSVEENSTGEEDLITKSDQVEHISVVGKQMESRIQASDLEKSSVVHFLEEDLEENSSRNKQKLDNRKRIWKQKQEHYEVQQIMDDREVDGKSEFLVRWKGYGEENDSWVKHKDFDDINIIKKYWKNKKAGTTQEIKKTRSVRQRKK